MKRKRLTALVIALAVLVSSIGIYGATAVGSKEISVNVQILESLQNERKWVIDTLVDGTIDDNPYALYYGKEEFLKDEVLANYKTNKGFKALIDAMDVYYNKGEYFGSLIEEDIAAIKSILMIPDDEEDNGKAKIDDVVTTLDDLRYDSVLNAVLMKDYTSTWGTSLQEYNMELETYRQRANMANKLDEYHSQLAALMKFGFTDRVVRTYDPSESGLENAILDQDDYIANFILSYKDDLIKYMENTDQALSDDPQERLEGKMKAAALESSIYVYEMTLPKTNPAVQASKSFEKTLCGKAWSVVGDIMDVRTYTFNRAIVLESVVAQKDSTVSTMSTLAAEVETSDPKMKEALDKYTKLIDDQGNKQINNYEEILQYMESQSTVTNYLEKTAKKGTTTLLKQLSAQHAGNAGNMLVSGMAKGLLSAMTVVNVTEWVADNTLGLKQTSQKIFLLKYVNKIISKMKELYEDDLKAYEANPTDENAKKVLDDLEFLKKLRLYAEECAYGSMRAQVTSWIGELLSGGLGEAQLNERYQKSLDILLGCEFVPAAAKPIELSPGDEFTANSQTLSNGKNTMVVSLKSGEDLIAIPEAEYMLMGGITANGAKITLGEMNGTGFIPYINSSGSTKLNIGNSDLVVCSINNADVLDVCFTGNGDLRVTESIDNAGGTFTLSDNIGDPSAVTGYLMNNNGTLNMNNVEMSLKGNIVNNGSVTGKVTVNGDGTYVHSNSYFKYGKQTVMGTGSWTDLHFANGTRAGVKVTGKQTVTGSFSNPATKLEGGKNIIVKGNCAVYGDYVNSALSFKDWTRNEPFTIKGSAFLSGSSTFNSEMTFKDGLHLTTECNALTINAPVKVKGDFQYDNGVVQGTGWLKMYGDINVRAPGAEISKLTFESLTPQNVTIGKTLTVGELDNKNKSLAGVGINSPIIVTDILHSESTARYQNGENLTVTGEAKLNGTQINGSISARDWVCTEDTTVEGTLHGYGTIEVADGVKLNTDTYKQHDGKLKVQTGSVIENAGQIYVTGALESYGKVSSGEEIVIKGYVSGSGDVSTEGDCIIKGAFTGSTLKAAGDIDAAGIMELNELILQSNISQKFKNTGSTNTKVFTIDNQSESGVRIDSVIRVSERFNNNCSNLINGKNIHMTGTAEYEGVENVNGDMTMAGTYTVPAGKTLTVNGSVTLASDAHLVIEEGAVLNVTGALKANHADINTAETAELIIGDYLTANVTTVTVAGKISVKNDTVLRSVTLTGTGQARFNGDMEFSGTAGNELTLEFGGNVPQTINYKSGEFIQDNVIVTNTTRTGVVFK